MGYVREPKNIDLVVGPSVLTDEAKKAIAHAIAQYRKSGQKPVRVEIIGQGSVQRSTHIIRTKTGNTQALSVRNRNAKI